MLYLRDIVYSFAPSEAAGVIDAWLAGAAATPVEGWTRAELAEHLRTEFSTFDWLLRPLLKRAGFAIQEVEISPSRTYAAYRCEKR